MTERPFSVVVICVDRRDSIGGASLRRSKINNQPDSNSKRAKYESNCSRPLAITGSFWDDCDSHRVAAVKLKLGLHLVKSQFHL